MEDKTTDQQVYKYTMYIYQHLLVSRDNWDIIPQKATCFYDKTYLPGRSHRLAQ